MRFRFEGTIEEFNAVFGAGFSEMDPETAAILDGAEGYLRGDHTPVVDFPSPVAEAPPLDSPVSEKELSEKALQKEARAAFQAFCLSWVQGFEENVEEQRSLEDKRGYNQREWDWTNAEEGRDAPQNMRTLEEEGRFDELKALQPDRLQLVVDLATNSRVVRPLLLLAYDKGSLQRLVEEALVGSPIHRDWPYTDDEWLDFIDRLSANIVAVSHHGFPDLVGTHDHTNKWRRKDHASEAR